MLVLEESLDYKLMHMLSKGESICKSIKYSDSIKTWNFCSKINRITILVLFLLLQLKNTLDQKSTWERKGFIWLTVPDLSPLLRGIKAGIPGRPTCCSTSIISAQGTRFPAREVQKSRRQHWGCWLLAHRAAYTPPASMYRSHQLPRAAAPHVINSQTVPTDVSTGHWPGLSWDSSLRWSHTISSWQLKLSRTNTI